MGSESHLIAVQKRCAAHVTSNVSACDELYQASPTVSPASDKHWGKGPGTRLTVLQEFYFDAAVDHLQDLSGIMVLTVLPSYSKGAEIY